ncbi:peroxidase family protein [Adhaeretor mobilis]|uniref:Peroxidase n=1 Tax=Adhaeretor mobilis TaxID=1930276 RepID=A0A517MUU4_9BACT|nr:peroxidase family protein [Adhaeretor mobilis]QDS98650.1 peroxidase [Adhaeretor mobilis]
MKLLNVFALLFASVLTQSNSPATAVEYRTIDGSGNNIANPNQGRADTPLVRMRDVIVNPPTGFDSSKLMPTYEDGINTPTGMTAFDSVTGMGASRLPNARQISNAVVSQGSLSVLNPKGASDWLWQWGQFIDHDIALEEPTSTSDPFMIPVLDSGDTLHNQHFPFIPFRRNDPALGTGVGNTPREQTNALTTYIDGSNVYGSDDARASFLRTMSGGQLKTSVGNNGEMLLPMNRAIDPFPNANPPVVPGDTPSAADQLFIAGDARANEQIGLTAVHTLFVREHNRLATSLAGRADLPTLAASAGFNAADATDVDEYIYQTSRKAVGAQIQRITYEEFLPMMLGDALSPYTGYDSNVNATLSNEFANAAYRVGHTMLSPMVQLYDSTGNIGEVALRDAYFNPQFTKDNGIETVLKGLSMQMSQDVDAMVIDEVRSFLFAEGNGGLDLAAVNIQRGRDHGLPTYNDMRRGLGLAARTAFSEITSDPGIATAFESIYDSIEDVDLWIGAIAEDAMADSLVGELLNSILVDQFTRLRDGDRFFYETDSDAFALFPGLADSMLSDVIMRNTDIDWMPMSAFHAVPEPGALAMFLIAIAGGTSRKRRAG